ncbi:hypothetical protein PtB15_7B315 [Puccinia triticina]|nr:hypothetical protein PtB15_7B315 [Puccinia triticina]
MRDICGPAESGRLSCEEPQNICAKPSLPKWIIVQTLISIDYQRLQRIILMQTWEPSSKHAITDLALLNVCIHRHQWQGALEVPTVMERVLLQYRSPASKIQALNPNSRMKSRDQICWETS